MRSRRLSLACCLVTVVVLCLPLAAAAQRQVTIGVVADGPWVGNATLFPIFAEEIIGLLGNEFDVELGGDWMRMADWTLEGAAAAVDELLDDDRVDLVLTVGPIASTYAGRRGDLTKPVVAAFVLDAEIQGLPYEDGRSGERNLSYVTFTSSVINDVLAFREVVEFDRLTFLVNQGFSEAVPELADTIRGQVSDLGIDVEMVPVAADVEPVLDALAGAEAVYVYPLMQLSDADYQRLVDGLIERRLPSFSGFGRSDVERGLLLSLYPDTDFQRIARRVALNIQRILLGDRPERIGVHFARGESFTLNMNTARSIDVYPTWGILTEAELVDQERREADQTWTLRSAVTTAVRVNVDIVAAEHGLRAAAENVALARAILLPQIDVSAQFRTIDIDRARASLGSAPQHQFLATLGLDQVIYSEAAWANREIQDWLIESEEYALEVLRLDTAEAAAVAFLNVLRAKTGERVARENLRLSRQNLDLARIREAVGAAGSGDIYRWEAEIANNRQEVIDASALRNQAEIQLNQILNRPTEEHFLIPEDSLADSGLLIETLTLTPYINNPWGFRTFRDFLSVEALANAPELAQIDAAIAAQERALLMAERALFVPDVALFGEGSWQADFGEGTEGLTIETPPGVPPPSFPESDDWNWVVGVGLSFPLYAGGERLAEINQTEHELDQLRAQRDSIASLVEQRTRSIVHAAGASHAGISLASDASTAADSALELVTDAYARGVVGVSDLIDAQTASRLADEAATNAIYDFLIDYIQAQRSTGALTLLMSAEERGAWLLRLNEWYQDAENVSE